MTNVESIYPYTIVEDNGLYGITDNQGNIIVPCVMDEISNDKEEKAGIELWIDFFYVVVFKDGKCGFFTRNGKFIEPVYEAYAIDPCGGDIHVKTEDGFGVFANPNYIFEERSAQASFLAEIGYDFEDDV